MYTHKYWIRILVTNVLRLKSSGRWYRHLKFMLITHTHTHIISITYQFVEQKVFYAENLYENQIDEYISTHLNWSMVLSVIISTLCCIFLVNEAIWNQFFSWGSFFLNNLINPRELDTTKPKILGFLVISWDCTKIANKKKSSKIVAPIEKKLQVASIFDAFSTRNMPPVFGAAQNLSMKKIRNFHRRRDQWQQKHDFLFSCFQYPSDCYVILFERVFAIIFMSLVAVFSLLGTKSLATFNYAQLAQPTDGSLTNNTRPTKIIHR